MTLSVFVLELLEETEHIHETSANRQAKLGLDRDISSPIFNAAELFFLEAREVIWQGIYFALARYEPWSVG